MGSGHIDTPVCECRGAFLCPRLELLTVWVILDIAHHEGQKMAVLVTNDVDEAIY